MGIDTANKRSSAIHHGSPWRSMWPIPDGSIDAGDRLHAAFLYSGFGVEPAEICLCNVTVEPVIALNRVAVGPIVTLENIRIEPPCPCP